MRDAETKRVRAAMRDAFPFLMRFFLTVSKETFVAERDGTLLGAVVTKTFRINRERTGGLVAFIFTNAEARGMGLGRKLVDHALAYFEERGCDELFASVEGTNTSSSRMFLNRGFTLASGGQLIKRYRFNVFRILVRTFHTIDLGHFLWIKPLPDYRERPTIQWVVNVLLNALFWTASFAMQRHVAPEGAPGIGVSILLSTFLLFAVRDVSTIVGAKLFGIRLQYRLWETSLLVNAIISIAFRGLFVSTGSFYPTCKDWRYKDEYARLGKIAAISSLVTLATLYGAFFLRYLLVLPPYISYPLAVFLLVGAVLTVFDTLLPLFPFNSSNAGRVFNWSKPVWIVIGLLGLGFVLLREFLL